jgi:hypothetical protein
MRRKLATIALTLLGVVVLSAGGRDHTILVDNFNDRDDVGWGHEDFTPVPDGGPSIFDASHGAYRLETTGFVPVNTTTDPLVGTLDAHWLRSEGRPRFANGTLRGTFRANTQGSTVGFLLRANDGNGTDYGFYGSTSFGTFYIERYDAVANPTAPQTIIAMSDPRESPFIAGRTYHVEASVVGHSLRMKAWKVGDREPRRPTLSLTDRGLDARSGSTICVIAMLDRAPLIAAHVAEVKVSGTFDNITFTPGDDD